MRSKKRRNQKADIDIHSTNKYSIEDDDIDKFDIILSWKDLSQDTKTEYINEYANHRTRLSLSKNRNT